MAKLQAPEPIREAPFPSNLTESLHFWRPASEYALRPDEAVQALRRRLDQLAETQQWVYHVADLDTGEEVATQINFPTALEFGPDAALYVSLPAVGGEAGSGQILRIDVTAALPVRGEDFDLTPPACLATSAHGKR